MNTHAARDCAGIEPSAGYYEKIGASLGAWIYSLARIGGERFTMAVIERNLDRPLALHGFLVDVVRASRRHQHGEVMSPEVVEAVDLLGAWDSGDPRCSVHKAAVESYWRMKHSGPDVLGDKAPRIG